MLYVLISLYSSSLLLRCCSKKIEYYFWSDYQNISTTDNIGALVLWYTELIIFVFYQ